MKKRTGLAIAGGVLEIVAGLSWLSFALLAYYIFNILGIESSFDWLQIIFPACFIVFGIMAIVGRKKSDLVIYGIFNLLFVAYLVYKCVVTGSVVFFIVFASCDMIMFTISSFFFFFTKESEYFVVFNMKVKEYTQKEPEKSRKLRKLSAITFAVLGVLGIVFYILCLGDSLFGWLSWGQVSENPEGSVSTGTGTSVNLPMIFIVGIIISVVFAVIYLVKNKRHDGFKVAKNILMSVAGVLFVWFGGLLCGLFPGYMAKIVSAVCCVIGFVLVLLPFRPRYAGEVSRLMKQEEQRKVYEKYEASIQPPLPQGLNQTQGQTLSAAQPVEQTQSREISEQTSVQALQQSQVQASGSPQAPNLPRMPQELKDRLQQQNNDNKNE